jgi:SAM-dependent methyltransferase
MPPDPTAPSGLPLTGERTVPGVPDETYWFERHVVAYRWAADRLATIPSATGAAPTVLDAGCGEGYGLALLAAALAGPGGTVIGVEGDPAVAEHARLRYAPPGGPVRVVTADLAALPLADASVDLAVSLQVVEHLHDVAAALTELRRVLRPGGTLVITTPNRLTFSPGRATPLNPFHVREFTADELAAALDAAGFTDAHLAGVHHGTRLRSVAAEHGADVAMTLMTTAPDAWPAWIAALVPTVTADDFLVDDRHVAASLDLVATARAPMSADTAPAAARGATVRR